MLQDKYSEYSDSGLMWVREYPSHWNLTKVKYEAYVKARVGWHGLKTDDFTDIGPYLVTGSDFKSSIISWKDCYHCDLARYEQDPYIQLQNGDLLLTKDGTIGKIALVQGLGKDEKATLNSGVFVVRPLDKGFTTEFYFWLLESTVFKKFFDYFKTGSTIVHLYQDTFVNFSYASPPLSEQTQIANFLDYETAQIDTLINKQQTLIHLLKEKRQAVISHAVTKGLNPDAPMKDSGVEWLGEVPEHWEVKKLKYVCDLISQKTEINYQEVIALENIESWTGNFVSSDSGYSGQDVGFDAGDILFSKLRPYLAKVYLAKAEGVAFGDLLVYRPKTELLNKYGFYLMTNEGFISAVNSSTYGSKMPRASTEFISEMPVVIPLIQEQKQIVDYVDKILARFDNLVLKAQKAIQLMQVRRTALISAAVTGKIDVRGWVAPEGDALSLSAS